MGKQKKKVIKYEKDVLVYGIIEALYNSKKINVTTYKAIKAKKGGMNNHE